MIQRERRGAFTLVEVMMVVLIIGLLMVLLLPAIGAVREAARRTECLSKLGQLGIAMQNYESQHSKYPGWQHHPFKATNAFNDKPITYSTSWFPQLLPYLGFEFLFDRTIPGSWTRPIKVGRDTYSFRPSLPTVAVCPSDFDKMRSKGRFAAWLSYVVNAGRKDVDPTPSMAADWRANGMFHDLWNWRYNTNYRVKTVKMDNSFIRGGDGLTNTLMLSENLDATRYYIRSETTNAFIFDPVKPNDFKAINGPGFSGNHPNFGGSYRTSRPSSNHPGGVNAVFASSSARFLHDEMDYRVYMALMTTYGENAREPGSLKPSPSSVTNQPKLTPDNH